MVMGIIIKSLSGHTSFIEVDPLGTVEALKRKIHEIEGIGIWQQCLLYNGLEMMNGNKLSDYSIHEGSEIILILHKSDNRKTKIQYGLRTLAEMHLINKMICRKCYCQLPLSATRCRKAKCGRTTDIRPKKTFIGSDRNYWPPRLFDKKIEWQ